MTSVDWRDRYGANWITSVRDQQSSENCWAFASTALYEAMVRIEHCLWNRRSEGDLVHGVPAAPPLALSRMTSPRAASSMTRPGGRGTSGFR
jgi:C1A family cysteine protease